MNPRFLLAMFVLGLAFGHPAAANAPPGRYTIANGMVFDTKTHLTWQQMVDAGTFTQADADAHCAALPLDGGNWRLPKISELTTIVDRTRSEPAIDLDAFPGTPQERFWTSSTYLQTAGNMWEVDFTDGTTFGVPPTSAYRVRCVR